MRVAIGKGLKSRSQAIRTAVTKYNTVAAKLVPPAPKVEFAQLLEWTELQEFELLRHSRAGDVRDQDWAKPTNRVMAVKFHKLARAREELVRCQVEMRRLVTAMHDEERHMSQVHADLQSAGNPLAPELLEVAQRRVAVNDVHRARFAKLAALFPAFAPFNVPGVRLRTGTTPSAAASDSPPPSSSSSPTHIAPPPPIPLNETVDEVQQDLDTVDDQIASDMGRVEDFLEGIQ